MADFHILTTAAVTNSRLGRFDARLKVVVVAVAIMVNLLSVNVVAPLLIAAAALGSLLISRVQVRRILLRLGLPLVMASVVFVTQLLLNGETVIGQVDVFGLTISAYAEGLERGLLIVARVIGGASLVIWLSLSTPVQQLLSASQSFRVPKVIVEITALMYRFIFVLLEEVITIRQAQQMRLGYARWRTAMKSVSVLAASLFFRAYDRAERLFSAMSVRGYSGSTMAIKTRTLSLTDYAALGLALSALLAIYLIGRLTL
ncbi:cobalt/nickel transport system permease protein [Dehalogenimonas formicexedens]|uniref:Cobalt/nickel transport system permease protein n=1 Tax=Dehalogenimonas formicexedens TaxID=1839801 RepID=A0A1P8F9G6_9CHLR|nr:cobalt ECF transporter T component CbiQ [Dehalogenimonas formicexedens]APV45111.1 cobalt/nickel transport system permease protein [Dehalogenimonas formicexedens]